MNTLDRRHLLTTAAGAGAALALGRWLEPTLTAADAPKQRIKIGQIGTGHEHASAKMSTFRKLIAFGQLTIAHRLVRLLVLEQLYRGFKILRGEPYHRD